MAFNKFLRLSKAAFLADSGMGSWSSRVPCGRGMFVLLCSKAHGENILTSSRSG